MFICTISREQAGCPAMPLLYFHICSVRFVHIFIFLKTYFYDNCYSTDWWDSKIREAATFGALGNVLAIMVASFSLSYHAILMMPRWWCLWQLYSIIHFYLLVWAMYWQWFSLTLSCNKWWAWGWWRKLFSFTKMYSGYWETLFRILGQSVTYRNSDAGPAIFEIFRGSFS